RQAHGAPALPIARGLPYAPGVRRAPIRPESEMRRRPRSPMRATYFLAAGLLAAVVLAACAGAGARTYSDPFAYCAAVGNVDAPDARYTGPPLPPSIVQGLRRAFGAPASAPNEAFTHGTFWRCMDGSVWACTVGANLPCQARADTSRVPS